MDAVPDSVVIQFAEADALQDQGDLDGALRIYEAIVESFPKAHEAWHKLGRCFQKRNQMDEAERCYREAISLWKDYPEPNNNLGLIVFSRGNHAEAERHYRVALAENPDYLAAHLNLANLLLENFRIHEAKYLASHALEIDPESPAAHMALGQALAKTGKFGAAITEFERAVELDAKFAPAWVNLGIAYRTMDRFDDAERAFSASLSAAPAHLPAWHNLLLLSNYRLGDREEIFSRHRAFGEQLRRQYGSKPVTQVTARPDPLRRLRIGFISSDFRGHSVAYFVRGAIAHLDRRQFQIFAYHNGRIEDGVTEQLKPLFHQWRAIYGLSDPEVTGKIQQDGIDILVDLNGHTGAARELVLAGCPAPVQVHWIGYPNTTGMDCIDYRITDVRAAPGGTDDGHYTEELWRLPGSFLCYTPSDSAPAVGPSPCIAGGHVSFGSFNNHAKLSDECLALWSEVLRANPDSRLVIKSIFGEGSEVRDVLLARLGQSGADLARIEIQPPHSSTGEHLAAYHDIDIALDPFPYNGTTTTCEALWMGVPVISLVGDRHAARVGASLLRAAGLDELLADSPESYIRIATELARNTERLATLRASMRERMAGSALMDRRAMGRELGAAFHEMWQRHCAGFPVSLPLEKAAAEQSEELLKLHIGGRERRDGWRILDVEQRDEVDFVGDIRKLESFADESCGEVYCSHVLARVGPSEILDTLNGLHRILVPGGRLYVSVPDLDVLTMLFAHSVTSKARRFGVMRMMFGGQDDESDCHKIGLYQDLMTDYLRDVGFASVQHVESFGLFDDKSEVREGEQLLSLNLIATK
jgi:predicted O-linked N-acetylglucosamine transferase (SPINDLY family)/predicted SAM-dependent methyltransferase